MRTRVVLLVICIFLTSTSYADALFSMNYGINQLVTKELNNRNGKASGTSQMFKLGLLSSNQEIGLYSNTISSSVKITHDSSENNLDTTINSVGAYIAFYKDPLYIEFGYGKASIRENLETNLEDTALEALKEIYDLNTDGDFSSTEARFLVGYKIYNSGIFTLTTYIQKIKMLETSHDSLDFGLELKIRI